MRAFTKYEVVEVRKIHCEIKDQQTFDERYQTEPVDALFQMSYRKTLRTRDSQKYRSYSWILGQIRP